MKLILWICAAVLVFTVTAMIGAGAPNSPTGSPYSFASEPYVGEIQWVPFNFAPRGWAFCDGQLLQIADNTALFSLLGTTYGGDGRTTFGLPDLNDRFLMHAGQGPGLSNRRQGDAGGALTVALTLNEMPAHNHLVRAQDAFADRNEPFSCVFSRSQLGKLYGPAPGVVPLAPDALRNNGGGQAHTNLQPYLGLNAIISLVGVYPSRN